MPKTVMTEKVIGELEVAFLMGMSDRQACVKVGISYSTFTSWLERNEDFRDKKEMLKESPSVLAKINIFKALKNGDIETSKWYAERKLKGEGFSTRVELDQCDEKAEINVHFNVPKMKVDLPFKGANQIKACND